MNRRQFLSGLAKGAACAALPLRDLVKAKLKTKGRRRLSVAASDAPAKSKMTANYVCDATDDQLEIQAALDALPMQDKEGE